LATLSALPIATDVAPFYQNGGVAKSLAFLASNLFFQIPAGASVCYKRCRTCRYRTYPLEKYRQIFTILGLPVNQILPAWVDTVKTED